MCEGAGNNPPSRNGARVIRLPKESGRSVKDVDRRSLVLGGLAAFAAPVALISTSFGGPKGGTPSSVAKSAAEGDAVTRPQLELLLLETLQSGSADGAEVEKLVSELETREGSQLFASNARGRWVLPWLGGWERVWANQPDASFTGGSARPSFPLQTDAAVPVLRAGSSVFQLSSARLFVYGPGEGGITVEYLHECPSAGSSLLLERSGAVANLGDNYISFDFSEPLRPYQVGSLPNGTLQLATGRPLGGSAESAALFAPPASTKLHTTYLSERLWVLRNERDESQVAVFERTETRSVFDRRGLVADGQLRPPADESIRYGRLLFGESPSDYYGWEAKEAERTAAKERLLAK